MPAQPPVGAVIRRARLRKRMSQGELAQKLGVSRSRVNAWERDRAYPLNPVAVEEVLDITLEPEPGRSPLADLEPLSDDDPMEREIAGRASISDDDKAWLIRLRRAIVARRQSAAEGHRAS